jgi:hypothetical protein
MADQREGEDRREKRDRASRHQEVRDFPADWETISVEDLSEFEVVIFEEGDEVALVHFGFWLATRRAWVLARWRRRGNWIFKSQARWASKRRNCSERLDIFKGLFGGQ